MRKLWKDEMVNRLFELYDDHTYEEIAKKINKEFKTKVSANSVRKAAERYQYPIIDKVEKKDKPKILVFDIETSPLNVDVWGIWNQNVGLNQIKKDWSVLSFAAKWLDSDEVIYHDTFNQKDKHDDKKLLKKIWSLLDEADITISHHGRSFDHKKLNARFALQGFKPHSSCRMIDTKRMASKHFKFTSNKLAYLTDKLCTKNKKLSHAKFPGYGLWKEFLAGNPEAQKEMEEYNRMDVLSLEELYYKLVPYDDSINFSVYFEEPTCTCGAENSFKKNGFYYTNANKFQRYKCTNCGKEYRARKSALSSPKDFRTTNRRG